MVRFTSLKNSSWPLIISLFSVMELTLLYLTRFPFFTVYIIWGSSPVLISLTEYCVGCSMWLYYCWTKVFSIPSIRSATWERGTFLSYSKCFCCCSYYSSTMDICFISSTWLPSKVMWSGLVGGGIYVSLFSSTLYVSPIWSTNSVYGSVSTFVYDCWLWCSSK